MTGTLDRIEAKARAVLADGAEVVLPAVALSGRDVLALVEVAKAAQATIEAHYATAGWATIAERTKLWDALDAQHAALARLEDNQ